MKPKIYLDTCSIQRPLDNKSQLRIVLEAEAVLGVLSLVEANKVDLIASEILLFEINRNSNQIRKEYALEVASKAKDFVEINPKIEKRSRYFNEYGIKSLDAVHLACAEEAHVDYFCTADDGFLKKARKVQDLKVMIVSPLELAKEL
jgi:predicted nucleic acid-binding protein